MIKKKLERIYQCCRDNEKSQLTRIAITHSNNLEYCIKIINLQFEDLRIHNMKTCFFIFRTSRERIFVISK